MNDPARSARRLPPIVRRLGVVSFFNDFASEMVYPLLPALVTARLGGTAVALGALDGVAEGASAVAKLVSGRLADRPGRRRILVVAGYALAALARPAMGVAGAAWQVVGLRGTDRVGKGMRNPARDAVIADGTAHELRGRAFGFHRGMDHAGAVVGPLVAWVLISQIGMAPDGVILWSLVPGVVAVVVVVWAMARVRARGEADRAGGGEEVVARARGSRFVFGLIVAFAFARMPETLMLLRLQDVGVSVALVPVMWSAMHVVRSAASYPGGWLSDRIGPRATMALGWTVYALVCAGLALSDDALAAAVWFAVFGLVAGATEGPERAFVAAAGGGGRRGSRFGVYHASVGLAALPGSLVLGGMYETLRAPAALGASAALAVVLAVLAVAGPAGPAGSEVG
jgi:MFS family permease